MSKTIDAPPPRLGDILVRRRQEILTELREGFRRLDFSPYNDLMLNTMEGRSRLELWVDLAINAFLGERDLFYTDQFDIGYHRARQGFSLADLAYVHKFYLEGVLEVLKRQDVYAGEPDQELLGDLQKLSEIAFEGLRLVAQSFIVTREELIAEKARLLQKLNQFTQKIMNTFAREEILRLTAEELAAVFKVRHCCLALPRGDQSMRLVHCSRPCKVQDLEKAVAEVTRTNRAVFIDPAGDVTYNAAQTDHKVLVAVPMRGLESSPGVAVLHHDECGFVFGETELELLSQFLYIAAMVLENSAMVDKIESHSDRLRLLTMRTLEVSEQQLKRLSEDIHDTLTQTLTGMSYKLQYCRELAGRESGKLATELDELVETARRAIDQSRNMIAGLHPGVIDNIGLHSALAKLASQYRQSTNLVINLQIDPELRPPAKATLSVYRVVQEALSNINKHARARRVWITFTKTEDRIRFSVIDDGRGFAHPPGPLGMPEAGKYGLFYMQQRLAGLGGELSLISSPGHGCKIAAWLPAAGAEGQS